MSLHEARPMEMAPRDGSMLRLLVQFEEHATEDTTEPAWTIGAYSEGADCWQFAGWCWTHDHFTEGRGAPVGWLPMLDDVPRAVPHGRVPDGWKLAMFVLQSDMFHKLPEEERAVCEALFQENPFIAATSPEAPQCERNCDCVGPCKMGAE